ncbi:MAG: polysaccharide biosynthesis protein [Bacilli bacterium]|nr:polysaccharide biosynthesis protein [Bacilli bacterium]
MKKNSFVSGTFIATFAIILVKILGIIYVIPFYKIIGEDGGALYSYAYNVYNLFLNISTAGIPIAISKIISEYNALEMYEAKERAYKIGRNITLIISIIAFFLLFVFAEEFATLILGKISGGNTIKDVGFVIKSVSFCLLIIPFLSVTKGYMQGHEYITVPSISQIIEQIVRIAVILMGSYITIEVLNKSVSLGVGIAVFGAFLGGVAAYIYIKYKIHKNKEIFEIKDSQKNEVTNKEIIKKIATYAIPFIIVSVATDIYGLTDMTLVVRASYKLGYTAAESETIASIIATWCPKICMIINAIAMGMTASLIPHIVSSFTKNKIKETNKKFNQALNIIIIVSLPLAIGLAALSEPVYNMFYGPSEYGTLILKYTAFQSIFASLFIIMSMALQSLNKFKAVYISTIIGFITNAILDIPLMYMFKHLGLHAFYGAILATIIGYIISYIIVLYSLKKNLKFTYKEITQTIKKVTVPTIAMCITIILLKMIIKTDVESRIKSLIICIPYAIIGGITYIGISYKIGLLNDVLGKDYINKITQTIKNKRK